MSKLTKEEAIKKIESTIAVENVISMMSLMLLDDGKKVAAESTKRTHEAAEKLYAELFETE